MRNRYRTLAITGGTGFVGRHVLRIAGERGMTVKALARSPQPPAPGVEWVAGALDDHAALARLCEGARAVIHIAGVINPPAANKYQHWTNDDVSGSIEQWWEKAVEHPGSWWPDWDKWLSQRSGDKVPARQPGSGKLKALEDAPGSYVKIKATD